MLSEEVEDALERVEVKPEVKMEEEFEEDEEDRVAGNNDVDYMVSVVDPHSIDVPNTGCAVQVSLQTLVWLFLAVSM